MAYFDSPKNKVLWEMELKELRKQREDFAAGKLVDIDELQKSRQMGAEHRKPVTMEQLEKEEHLASASRREAKASPGREMGTEPARSRENPIKSRTPVLKAKSLKGR